MNLPTVKDLLDAGVHFGAPSQTWDPRMKPYIHAKRNRIHIINLVHTIRGLAKAVHFLESVAKTGRQIVLVCTKRQMRGLLHQEATKAGMPWVTERWLGGTLTNFKTVRERLSRLEELEAMDENGQLEALPKKAQSMMNREARRIRKNLDGLRDLSRVPGAMLVVDPKREHIAVAEARRMGVPVVGILDTDCDPTPVDIRIPANDDSMRSVGLLLTTLGDAILRGSEEFKQSGRAPEDAVGRVRGEQVQAITAEDMLETSGVKEGVTAAAAEKAAETPEAPAAAEGTNPETPATPSEA